VQGQLRSENLTFHIETRCGHCDQPLHLEVNSDLDVHVVEKEAEPLIFVPQVNFGRLQDPSIIDAF
jgi:hypothetical protein